MESKFPFVPAAISKAASACARLARLTGAVLFATAFVAPGSLHAAGFESLYTFNYEGFVPLQLVQADGTIYGITAAGGGGLGTLFSFDPRRKTETVLETLRRGCKKGARARCLSTNLATGFLSRSKMVTSTTITQIPRRGKTLYNFNQTQLGVYSQDLLRIGNNLYGGVVAVGGFSTLLFKLDLKTKQVQGLFTFSGGTEGGNPDGNLIYQDGQLYGAVGEYNNTQSGGIFSYNLATGAETMVDILNPATDGAQADSLVACGGILYGTAYEGGSSGLGTVFSFNPATDQKKTLYTFAAAP